MYATEPKLSLQRSQPSPQIRHTSPLDAIERAYCSTGGLASGEEIALLLRRHCEQPLSQLARWIVSGKVVHFDLGGSTFLPLFQFDLDRMAIRPEVTMLIDELSPGLDPLELTCWFGAPNDWLAGATPVEKIRTDFAAVREAARADRFIGSGLS